MASVKIFRITEATGVPGEDVREFLSVCESRAIIQVTTQFIPGFGKKDPQLVVIVTKLDELPMAPLNGKI